MQTRLQKLLAAAGLGSRREIERWISDGRIRVNGKPAVLGQQASVRDTIQLDGRAIAPRRLQEGRRRVLAYHKPSGEVVTRSDPEGRPTVFERLPKLGSGRWIAVGRLDLNTDGLILFTNDGELANRLMHPAHGIEREYAVRVLGEVGEQQLHRLRTSVQLEDGPAHFQSIVDLGGEGRNHWYRVTLKEGRNREVRRLWESQNVAVSRLIRIRFGPITMQRYLRSGHWEELPPQRIGRLLEAAGIKEAEAERGKKRPTPRAKGNRARARQKRRNAG